MAPANNRGREPERERDRPGKHISHRAMLSRALHRANMAVNLDNAQNFEAARLSYADACNLLHQVVQRTSGDEEKRKLEAIVINTPSTPTCVAGVTSKTTK
jgi:chemotaxis regulatin CheY-phosphate phosphatase CheZ